MPKIDPQAARLLVGSTYPRPFDTVCAGREKSALGDVAGLTQFGVNLTRLKPGAESALRHWHEREDEFVYVLEGELILEDNTGETRLRPGDSAGFKAGDGNGHRLVNRTGRDALYLEIGTRAAVERVHYSDVDLRLERDANGRRFMKRSGELYES